MDDQFQSDDVASVTGNSDLWLASAPDSLLIHSWITPERFARAKRVWSKAYGRVITDDEVTEILLNVRRLAEALLHASQMRSAA